MPGGVPARRRLSAAPPGAWHTGPVRDATEDSRPDAALYGVCPRGHPRSVVRTDGRRELGCATCGSAGEWTEDDLEVAGGSPQ